MALIRRMVARLRSLLPAPPSAALDRIRSDLNRRYQAGDAYSYELAWDRRRHEAILRAAVDLAINGREPGATLELGCGRGALAQLWAHRPLVAVDLSAAAIDQARILHPDVEFHVGAAESYVDPQQRRFRTIVAIETIEHWHDVDAGLATVARHLEADGCFIVTTPNADSLHHRIGRKLGRATPLASPDHEHEFGHQELIDRLAAAGFEVQQSVGVFLMPWWSLEAEFGQRIRLLTDHDEEVLNWLEQLGSAVPELAYVQCHACRRIHRE